jgi:hypothetical protein
MCPDECTVFAHAVQWMSLCYWRSFKQYWYTLVGEIPQMTAEECFFLFGC